MIGHCDRRSTRRRAHTQHYLHPPSLHKFSIEYLYLILMDLFQDGFYSFSNVCCSNILYTLLRLETKLFSRPQIYRPFMCEVLRTRRKHGVSLVCLDPNSNDIMLSSSSQQRPPEKRTLHAGATCTRQPCSMPTHNLNPLQEF